MGCRELYVSSPVLASGEAAVAQTGNHYPATPGWLTPPSPGLLPQAAQLPRSGCEGGVSHGAWNPNSPRPSFLPASSTSALQMSDVCTSETPSVHEDPSSGVHLTFGKHLESYQVPS